MYTKHRLLEVLLVAIVGLCRDVNSYISYPVSLTTPLETFTLKSPGYPNHAPPSTYIEWTIKGTKDSRLDLYCDDIYIPKRVGCKEGSLYIWAGGSSNSEICSITNAYSKQSTGNQMTVLLKTGPSEFGRMRCGVRLVPTQQDHLPSMEALLPGEPDSREQGLGNQRRQPSCECGKTNRRRIVGGRETEENEFIFMVYLKHEANYEGFCSGSIVSARHVLTAAHCVSNNLNRKFKVVVGGHDIVKGSTKVETLEYGVQNIHIHEGFNLVSRFNDIAILEVDEDIRFGQFVGPVCLPQEPYSLDKQWVKALGWGQMIYEVVASPTLRKVNLNVIDLERCNLLYQGKLDVQGRTQLCTLAPGRDTCQGDDGGPVLYLDTELDRFVIVGLTSYGKEGCAEDTPKVNTDVFAYFDWIQRVVFQYRDRNTGQSVQTCEKM